MSAVLPVYKRSDYLFVKGKGVYLYTEDNKRYLDFAAGIAVNAMGHGHPHMVKALTAQARKLWHVSNLYKIPGLEELAQRLANHSFGDKVFFCNSGAEAVECGLKMIRKYHDETGNPRKYRIIVFTGAFHGRTLATISASDRSKVMQGFEPAVEGFDHVEFNNLDAVRHAITPETAGILVETIQGEGGVRAATKDFIQGLRKLADEHRLLLMLDDVQCGMGRTGKLFSYERYGIKPDILASAKGIGNGFPLGACLATDRAAIGMKPGTHGSTYGANPLAMAVGNAVLDLLLANGFLEHVLEVGEYLEKNLRQLMQRYPDVIEEVRGQGLMLGLKVKPDNAVIVEKLRENRLLTVPASDNVIRLLPPLIVEKQHIDDAVKKLNQTFRKL